MYHGLRSATEVTRWTCAAACKVLRVENFRAAPPRLCECDAPAVTDCDRCNGWLCAAHSRTVLCPSTVPVFGRFVDLCVLCYDASVDA